MKKLLILFVVLDFIFVGLILKVISSTPSRTISSVDDSTYNQLTDGQKTKWDLVKTLKFEISSEAVSLITDNLQMICDTSALIELQFSAQNVAFAGAAPMVSHTFSCDSIRKDQAANSLHTTFSDFKNIQQTKKIDLGTSRLAGFNIYTDEKLPLRWRLTAVRISGPSTFTINEFEIEKVLMTAFEFNLPTFVK